MPIYTYTTFDDPSGTNTFPLGMNDAGQIVGGYTSADSSLHFGIANVAPADEVA
jgi:hypothetical protein